MSFSDELITIPEHLDQPEMSAEHRKRILLFVMESRKEMSNAPAFDTVEEAIEVAVLMDKSQEYSFPSVWKEPTDIGHRYTVVHHQIRHVAHNAGYTEEIDEQKIFDLTRGINRED